MNRVKIGKEIPKKLHDCDILCTLRPTGGWPGYILTYATLINMHWSITTLKQS